MADGREREAPSRPQPRPPSETALIPTVAAMACLLYVFGHAPVEGHEVAKLA